VNAQVRALRWMTKANADQVIDIFPTGWIGPDKDLYRASLAKAFEGVSKDGLMGDEAVRNVHTSLLSFDQSVAAAKDLDLSKTRDNSFVRKALETLR